MELNVQKRDKFGKQLKTLRNEGLIPAELYGNGIENLHLSVPLKEFTKVFSESGESTMININLGDEKRPVLIYNVSLDPVSDKPVSVDFYQVRLDEKIQVNVPIQFVGESEGVKSGGILIKALKELELETLPANIPHSIEVDLTKLTEIGKSVYVKDLEIPSGIKVLIDPGTVVASVTEPISEEEEAALSKEADVSVIKSESEEKKQERESEKSEQGEEKSAK